LPEDHEELEELHPELEDPLLPDFPEEEDSLHPLEDQPSSPDQSPEEPLLPLPDLPEEPLPLPLPDLPEEDECHEEGGPTHSQPRSRSFRWAGATAVVVVVSTAEAPKRVAAVRMIDVFITSFVLDVHTMIP